ncbi:hypothetical protein SDC9_142067 [bioreactor metagenome]|uniref:Uncharacterized protein n=1 Tax=bioreactor metagenome TaxID=1076179 RepID=A0A645E0N3_9ZZZZ
MHHDPELEVRLITRTFLENLTQFALNLDAHCQGALQAATAFAVRTIIIHSRVHALRVTLTGHLHEAQLRDGQDMGFGLVAPETFLHALIDRLLVAARFHIDEVEHDQAAHVAEPQLASDLVGGFNIHL